MNFTQLESTDYHSYLLRLRRDGEQRPWRASLRCSTTGTLHHFATMAHLIGYLQGLTGSEEEFAARDSGQGDPGQGDPGHGE